MKQVLIVRTDLKMGKGKIAAQCSHASVEAADKSSASKKQTWKQEGMKKVVLKADSLEKLKALKKKAESLNIKTALIVDAGHTQIKSGTITVLGLGPDDDEKIDKVTKGLKLL